MSSNEDSSTGYLDDGTECRVIAQDGDRFVVAPMYESSDPWDDEEDYREGEPRVAYTVHRRPPVPRRDADYRRVLEKTTTAEKHLNELRRQIREMEGEHEAVSARLLVSEPLKHCLKILDSPPTHAVTWDYRGIRWGTIDDKILSEDGERHSSRDIDQTVLRLKLKRRKGRGAGRLEWEAPRTWGGGENLVPCYSKDEALEVARAKAVEWLAEFPDGNWNLAVESAGDLGVEVPEKILEKIKADRIEVAEKRLKEAEVARLKAGKALQEARQPA